MAWDRPRRYDPLPQALEQPALSVDELDLYKTALDFSYNTRDANLNNMRAQLSPIREERWFPACNAPLQVHVTARFHDPAIKFTYSRTYDSSDSFVPTERICRGLMRRIEHCSEEIITRKDADALNATQCLHKGPKHLRFELTFELARAGHSGIWAETSFKSYQKHALTSASAKEVLRSTHRIVGLFLRRHDKGFEWTDEPAREDVPNKPETAKPSSNGTLNLACVPRTRFIESHQTWEFIPGYTLELVFKSTNPARRQSEIRRILKFDSGQNAPLNLRLGEDLLWQAHSSVQDVLDQKKSSFDLEHADCDGYDGVSDCDCQHFDENALDVGLRIVNNLGPVYDHLHRSVQSRLRLFTHPRGQDCDEFVHQIQAGLNHFRDRIDKKMESLNDFDFRIAEMTGHGWHEKNCARFILDGKRSHSRPSIEALVDRIRTGVSDTLRGSDVAIRMVAYKRGHLILDKALIARRHQSTSGLIWSPENQQQKLLTRLKTRIQLDIDMICKDTCSIDDTLEPSSSPDRNLSHPRPAFSPSRAFAPREAAQRQKRLGLPGNFERPPTPPEIPAKGSSRIFPLVPSRNQEEKWLSREIASMKDSVVRMNCNDELPFVKSAVGVTTPPVHQEDERQGIANRNNHEGLKSAAEVYPASKEEHETDSSSTHSSVPALTESDTPSPGQSMLITPSCLRSSSPTSDGIPSIEDLRSLHFSHPFVVDTSAPNSSMFSEVDRFEDPKVALPRNTVLPSGRPKTPKPPDAEKSAPVNTPRAAGDTSSEDKTPVPHGCMQGPIETNGQAGHGLIATHSAVRSDNLKPVLQVPPTEGWPLCPMAKEQSSEIPAGNTGNDEASAPIAECDSSETLRPSVVLQQGSIDGLAGLRDTGSINTDSLNLATVSEQPCPSVSEEADYRQSSVPTEQSKPNWEPGSGDGMRAMTLEEELSRSKLDFFEQGEDSASDSETTENEYPARDVCRVRAGSRPMGLSERSEATGHVTPFSDSGSESRTSSETTHIRSSEFEPKHVLSPIQESAFEFGVDGYESGSQGLETSLTEPTKRETASGPLDSEDVRRGDEVLPVSTEDSAVNPDEGAESPSEDSKTAKKGATSDPTQVAGPVEHPQIRNSAPNHTARVASNPQPSPTRLDVGAVHLLPSLPILSTLRSVSHDARAGCSTPSSWEDYVPAGRQSSDSVDTIEASPAGSEQDDRPDSPKRLGTPTAGLLGLHESIWAEFGIRAALTGTRSSVR